MKMKKFTYIFLLASCLLLASCESWLDEDPQYTLNTQIQFSTSEKARAALYGCYGYFALTSGGYGQHWQESHHNQHVPSTDLANQCSSYKLPVPYAMLMRKTGNMPNDYPF